MNLVGVTTEQTDKSDSQNQPKWGPGLGIRPTPEWSPKPSLNLSETTQSGSLSHFSSWDQLIWGFVLQNGLEEDVSG